VALSNERRQGHATVLMRPTKSRLHVLIAAYHESDSPRDNRATNHWQHSIT
jgi:hypothetical protein